MRLPIDTLLYMAPEILYNNEACSKSDVYSFGLLLNFIFTGKDPIEKFIDDYEHRNILLNTKNYQISFNPDDYNDYEEIGEIILKCLVQDPNQRLSFDEIKKKLKK